MALKLPTHLATFPPALAYIFPRVRALTMKSVRAIWQSVCVCVGVSVCMSVYRACVLCEILPYIAKHFHAF